MLLFSSLVSGPVRVSVRDQLPVAGVDLILGNDLASVKVFPVAPEITENPVADVCVDVPAASVSSLAFPVMMLACYTG